jgi:hypothetical protein
MVFDIRKSGYDQEQCLILQAIVGVSGITDVGFLTTSQNRPHLIDSAGQAWMP